MQCYAAVTWEGSWSPALCFEFTPFLFLSPALSALQSSLPLAFSFPFPWVAPCPQPHPLRVLPLTPPPTFLNSIVLQASFLFPFEISYLCPFFFLVILSSDLPFLRKKAGGSCWFSLITETVFFSGQTLSRGAKTLLPQLIGRLMAMPGRERRGKTLDCWGAFPTLDFVQTGSK